jgi:hypothetical protein
MIGKHSNNISIVSIDELSSMDINERNNMGGADISSFVIHKDIREMLRSQNITSVKTMKEVNVQS